MRPPMQLRVYPPNNLIFPGNGNSIQSTILFIHNPSAKTISWRLRTAAPSTYAASPHTGVIERGEAAEVDIIYRPKDFESAKTKKHGEFLLLAREIPPGTNDKAPYMEFPKDLSNTFMAQRIPFRFADSNAEQQTPTNKPLDINDLHEKHDLALQELDSYHLHLSRDVEIVEDKDNKTYLNEVTWEDELARCSKNIRQAGGILWTSRYDVYRTYRNEFMEFYAIVFFFFALFFALYGLARRRKLGVINVQEESGVGFFTVSSLSVVSSVIVTGFYILLDAIAK